MGGDGDRATTGGIILHLEPVVDAAVATLRAQLAAQIVTENLRHTDFAIPAIDPARILFGSEQTITSFPSVEVAASDSNLTDFSQGQADWDTEPRLLAQGWVGELPEFRADGKYQGEEGLYRATLRFGRALLSTLLVPNAFGNNSTVDAVRVSYRMNPETATVPRLSAAALLIFTLSDVEVP